MGQGAPLPPARPRRRGPPLNATRWLELSPHLDRLLELDEEARASAVAELGKDDAALAHDLAAALLDLGRLGADRFLETPFEPESEDATLAGRHLGAYTLVSPLGQGGMGSVWLARRSD